MIRRGEGWGAPAGGSPDVEAAGDDVALAAAVRGDGEHARIPRVRFDATPDSDLARSVGLVGKGAASIEVTLDVMAVDPDLIDPDLGAPALDGTTGSGPWAGDLAVNAIVVGPPPDRLHWWHRRRPLTVVVDGRTLFDGRATTVLVANGQFLRGHDVVPAGHPGDGRCEVQVYALGPGERTPMRRRLAGGAHLPHPRIATSAGRSVLVEVARPGALEVDGTDRGRADRLRAVVRQGAYRLLV
ncbi:MAG TPA: hypothetical protein VMX12_13270 [Acidimicrobiia bacterium]|nr:hypothetical protein [Acidimicrobiia bacterium]